MLAKSNTVLTDAYGEISIHRVIGDESIMGWSSEGVAAASAVSGFMLRRHAGRFLSIRSGDRELVLSDDHPCFTALPRSDDFVDLLLLEREGEGAALGLVRSFSAVRRSRLFHYRRSAAAGTGKESLWIVERFTDRNEGNLALHLLACRYGLPMVDIDGTAPGLERSALEKIFREEDTLPRAARLRDGLKLDERHPHLTMRLLDDTAMSRRMLVDFDLFLPRKGCVLTIHTLSPGVSPGGSEILPVKDRSIELTDFDEGVTRIQEHFSGNYVDIQTRARFGRIDFTILPASSLRKGMLLPAFEGVSRVSPVRIDDVTECRNDSMSYGLNAGDLPAIIVSGFILPRQPWPVPLA